MIPLPAFVRERTDMVVTSAAGVLAVLALIASVLLRTPAEDANCAKAREATSEAPRPATPATTEKIVEERFTTGIVTEVIDGDTLKMDIEGELVTIRLFGIDAPERDQPHGSTATQVLSRWTLGEELIVLPMGVDPYERLVAGLYFPGERSIGSVSIGLTHAGLAWAYREYLAEQLEQFLLHENDARANGRGLWAAENAVPPWEWRDGART